jgi:hypothetical protein
MLNVDAATISSGKVTNKFFEWRWSLVRILSEDIE